MPFKCEQILSTMPIQIRTVTMCAQLQHFNGLLFAQLNEVIEKLNRQMKHRNPVFLHTCRCESPQLPLITLQHPSTQPSFTLYDCPIQSICVIPFLQLINERVRDDFIEKRSLQLRIILNVLIESLTENQKSFQFLHLGHETSTFVFI